MTSHKNSQSGNVLFIILIAVVLLGVLTMILSRGGSNVEQSGDFEQLSVQASQIMRYARSVEAAVQNIQLRDISENDISFANTLSTTDYTNPNCDDANDRSFPSCLIFDARGEGLNYLTPETRWLDNANSAETYFGDWLFTGNTCIPEIGDDLAANCLTGGSRNFELIMILPYITLNLCRQINRIAQASITTGNPPSDNENAWDDGSAEFTGTYNAASARLLSDSPVTDMAGSHSGCFQGDTTPATGTYHFYHVLKAR